MLGPSAVSRNWDNQGPQTPPQAQKGWQDATTQLEERRRLPVLGILSPPGN